MTKEYIDELIEYLCSLDECLPEAKNSIEKYNVVTKAEELVFWLGMYKARYLEEENK